MLTLGIAELIWYGGFEFTAVSLVSFAKVQDTM